MRPTPGILAEPVIASVMAMITSGNDTADVCGHSPETGGMSGSKDVRAGDGYDRDAAHASAVSCAWYELRTSGPDST